MSLYLERPVFTWPIDWANPVNQRVEFDLRRLDLGFNAALLYGEATAAVHGFQFEVTLDAAADIAAVDEFFAALGGRLSGFWLPGPHAAFKIVGSVSATQLKIEAQGLTATLADHPGLHLYATQDGHEPQAVRVQSAVDNDDGTETVSLNEAAVLDASWYVRPLYYVRLAEDSEEGRFLAENRQRRRIRCLELPHEYTATETGQQPVWFYDFWFDGASPTHWRFTSFAWDLSGVGGFDWKSARLTHGPLTRRMSGDKQQVTLDLERIAPLTELVPPRACTPLRVQILTADLGNLSAQAVVFTGVVTAASVQGPKVRARCSALTGSLTGVVPRHLFSPRCAFKLFEPGTCGLNRAAWQKALTITSISGRTVVVNGASLSGLGANWFADGWLEAGSGSEWEARLILANTAAVDDSLTLTLNAPLHYATADRTAVLLPGCDGTEAACQAKFNNFTRWGGFRFAARNLALKALDTPPLSGGKK